jgi:capsular polysaccharide transport system permease protein
MSEWLSKLRQHRLPLLLIGVPLLVCGLYLGLISKDRFVSESRVIVKEEGHSANLGLDIGALLGGGDDGSARDDASMLKEYIESPDMLKKLDAHLNFKEAFAHSGLDIINRLWPNATREEVLRYYQRRITVDVEDKTGILIIRTEGFTPEYSQAFNHTVLSESESFLNEMSHKISRNEMQFSRGQMDRSYDEVRSAREAVIAFENKTGILDPTASAQAGGRMVVEMGAKQAELEAELRNMLTYLNEDAPEVTAKKNALASLVTQITIEKNKLSAPGDGKMNRTAAQYAELKARLEFAMDLYKVSLASFEKSRLDSSHKTKSLGVVVSPNLPEEAENPRKFHILASLATGLLLLFGVLKLAKTIIEDHRI